MVHSIIKYKIQEIRETREMSILTDNRDQLVELKRMFSEAGIPATSGSSELRLHFRYANCLGYYWTSDFRGGGGTLVISFTDFIRRYCELPAEEPPKLPKLHDKQVLQLAALIGVQDSLVEQLKANGNAIKALKAEMGIA